jgi:hypothetical protein
MKTRSHASRAACVLAALIMFAAGGAGDDQQKQQSLPVIDLSFAGGTVIDYVAALRKATGDANVVVDPEAAEVVMPPVTLRHVTVPAALEVLKGRTVVNGELFVQLDVAHVPSFSPEERPTYQVQARVGGRNRPAAPSRATKVWTVSSLLGGDLTSRKLLSAVETALEVVGSEPKPDVRFHEDTGLVIARGNESQIDAIAAVIDQLNNARNQRQNDQVAALKRRLEECQKNRGSIIGDPTPGERRDPGE